MPPRKARPAQEDLPFNLRDYVLDSEAIDKIPSQLMAVEDFLEKWDNFVQYRSKVLNNSLTNGSAQSKLKKLLKHLSHANPCDVIDAAIDHKWIDLYPENINSYADDSGKSTVLIL